MFVILTILLSILPIGLLFILGRKFLPMNNMLRILFRINFGEFITPKLISRLYLLSIFGIGVFFILGGSFLPLFFPFDINFYYENVPFLYRLVLQIIISIPLYLIVIALLRVICEFVIVVFKIEENTRQNKSP